MLHPSIAALFLSVAVFSTAHAKDTAFSTVVSCEKYEGSFLTKVSVDWITQLGSKLITTALTRLKAKVF